MKQSEINKDIIDIVNKYSLSTNIPASFIEKDIYVVKILSALSKISYPNINIAFSGGTCLSKAQKRIKRFSEDLDFCIQTEIPFTRKDRSNFRKFIMAELDKNKDFKVVYEPIKITDENNFFSFEIEYNKEFELVTNLRKNIKIEFKFENLICDTAKYEIQTLIHQFINDETVYFNCVNIIEILANKLSALLWRVYIKNRTKPIGTKYNDPTIIRHLYDLSALEAEIRTPAFYTVFSQLFKKDISRAEINEKLNIKAFAQEILTKIEDDKNYAKEYANFVESMCYDKDVITFEKALNSLENMVKSM